QQVAGAASIPLRDVLAAMDPESTKARELAALIGQLEYLSNDPDDRIGFLSRAGSDLVDGARTSAAGATQLADGADGLAGGARDLATGTSELAGGIRQFSDGVGAFSSGVNELSAGASQLSAGVGELS